MEYKCNVCDMGVKGVTCSKCDKELVDGHINKDGKDIHVAKCPTGCGMILSPSCCGQDMACLT